ncbi:CRISPR-associated endonuclease/helicase Cas3 [Chitinivorax tropicus]|uniref:CRISPR-associated endonuclease/helicase Cas3 n=2 Tax=Chitinivorax tropicus TaxID=714531 RepID=A0A840MTB2_9PROT|nr:HD domain-containing protein [Chitinivorax tropicus]MBB5018451.1 CRISPR-associated endonuclease/helicase Cas3 [Chitinivorax tropicus]
MTPITHEGLQTLWWLLKRVASRHTAVACYRNDGHNRMKLLWIVGSSKPFGPEGHFPIGSTQRRRLPVHPSVRGLCLLAATAGVAHDLGKVIDTFQAKLWAAIAGKEPPGDPIRHEWVSMRLLQLLRTGIPLDQAWTVLAKPNRVCEEPRFFCDGLRSVDDVLDFSVATHHRLFGPRNSSVARPDASEHCHQERHVKEAAPLPADIVHRLARLQQRLQTHFAAQSVAGAERILSLLTRAALILADHAVSSQSYPGLPPRQPVLLANTRHVDKRRIANQPLGWHLQAVGDLAGKMALNLARLSLPGLQPDAIERILTPAPTSGRFAWQNEAVRCIQSIRQSSQQPVLVFNMARTGAGKTLVNAKMACAFSPRPRLAYALNLRTLTLQTGASLKRTWQLEDDELSVLIGEQVVARLHEQASASALAPDGGQADEPQWDYWVTGDMVELPAWLEGLERTYPRLPALLGSPILVSTVDFLIGAMSPGLQARHIIPLLRLIDSDLILDEIDSYTPIQLIAILGLIQVTAMLGRSVICASATLSLPVANSIHRAFQAGFTQRQKWQGIGEPSHTVVVNDLLPPHVMQANVPFEAAYQDCLGQLRAALPTIAYRRPTLLEVKERSESAWLDSIQEGAQRLHDHHAWTFRPCNRQISFGLVRVANIRTAIMVADFLAGKLPHAFVACYHAQDFLIQRHLKEHRLDTLLRRSHGQRHIEEDEEIRMKVAGSKYASIPFIVVATPVEEIGRDHDFDWAVIEPSSLHSVIQTAGRVNRHRLVSVQHPNVAILQFNRNWVGQQQDGPVFIRPGLEAANGGGRYKSADLAQLLDWSALHVLDNGVRFSPHHQMALDEDRLLQQQLDEPLKIITGEAGYNSCWMTQGFYHQFRLRAHEPMEQWLAERHEGQWRFIRQLEDGKSIPCEMGVLYTPARPNQWLAYSLDELHNACLTWGISTEQGLSVRLRVQSRYSPPCYDVSFGLYWRVQAALA